MPIVQSTTYVYDSTEEVAAVFGETLATPIPCKPFAFGADIIVHSTSKYMDGHAVQICGAIVDSGNLNQNDYRRKYEGYVNK